MGIMISPLVLTSGFLTDTIMESEVSPSSEAADSPPHHNHLVKERAWRKYQPSQRHVMRLFHPLLQAAQPLKMPAHIIDDINRRRREEENSRRPYAPSPLPPGEFPPGHERPESQHRSNIDGDSGETGERGIVIIDFEI